MTSPGDPGSVEAISQRRNQWIAAINAADADGFVAVLTEDAVWLPMAQAGITGKEQIRRWLVGPFAEFAYEYEVTDVRLRLAGDWAVERSRFTTRARGRDGRKAPTHEGTYTILWRNVASAGWLIDRYIDHTDEDEG